MLTHAVRGNQYVNLETGKIEEPDWASENDLLGNQPSSTEDATVERTTTASNQDSESNSETGSSESLNNREQVLNNYLQNDLGIDMSVFEEEQEEQEPLVYAPSSTSDISTVPMNPEKTDTVRDIIEGSNEIIDTDSDGDGNTDVEEKTLDKVDQFYEDLYYNEVDAPSLQEQYDKEYDKEVAEREELLKDAKKYGPAKDSIYLGGQTHVNRNIAAKDIDTTAESIYNETVRDVAVKDYLETLTEETLDDGTPNPNYDPNFKIDDIENKEKFYQELYKRDANGIHENKAFGEIFKNVEEESKAVKTERAKLSRDLTKCLQDTMGSDDCQVKYDEGLKSLNDRFHSTFEKNLKSSDRQEALRLEIQKQIDSESDDPEDENTLLEDAARLATFGIINPEREAKKRKKKDLEKTAQSMLEDEKAKANVISAEIEQVNKNALEQYSKIEEDFNWLNGKEKGEGQWTLNEIEKIKNQEFKGDESILAQIKEIQETEIRGDQAIIDELERLQNPDLYSTQEEVDAANKKIEQLSIKYDEDVKNKVDAANAKIQELSTLYRQSVNQQVKTAEQQIQDLAKTYLDKEKSFKDNKLSFDELSKLDTNLKTELSELNVDVGELDLFKAEARKTHKGYSALAIAGGIGDFFVKGAGNAIDMAMDVKEEMLNKIENPTVRKAVDLLTYAYNPAMAGMDALFNDRKVNPETGKPESLWDRFDDNYDEWKQDKIDSRIEDPPKFEELVIDGKPQWADITEYGLTMATSQIPASPMAIPRAHLKERKLAACWARFSRYSCSSCCRPC